MHREKIYSTRLVKISWSTDVPCIELYLPHCWLQKNEQLQKLRRQRKKNTKSFPKPCGPIEWQRPPFQ